ncbi:MAG: VOC family protein [Actinomycetota bacterium]|nr:VOC family protein [Actinomycetota bacterium]
MTTPPPTPPPLGIARFRDLCLDANDPAVVGGFWAAVLGRQVQPDEDGPDVFLPTGADGGPAIYVNAVPEPKAVKDRIHLDITLEPAQEIPDLLRLGATIVTEPGEVRWWVLADPEGNEFCAFLPDADASNDADAEVAP